MSDEPDIESMSIAERLGDERAQQLTEREQKRVDEALAPVRRRTQSSFRKSLERSTSLHASLLQASDPLGLRRKPWITSLTVGNRFNVGLPSNIVTDAIRQTESLTQLGLVGRPQGGPLGLMLGEDFSKRIATIGHIGVDAQLGRTTESLNALVASVVRPAGLAPERFMRGLVGGMATQSIITTVGLAARMDAQQAHLQSIVRPSFDLPMLGLQLRSVATVPVTPAAFATALGAGRFAVAVDILDRSLDEGEPLDETTVAEAAAVFGIADALMERALNGEMEAIGRVAPSVMVQTSRRIESGGERSNATVVLALTLVGALSGVAAVGIALADRYAPIQREQPVVVVAPPTVAAKPAGSELDDDLAHLAEMRRRGELTAREYADAKALVLEQARGFESAPRGERNGPVARRLKSSAQSPSR